MSVGCAHRTVGQRPYDPTGRAATYVIAASDAPEICKAQADIVDGGTNVIDSINVGLASGYHDFYLSEGNFVAANDGNITQDNINIHGAGWSTVITVKDQTVTALTAQLTIGTKIVTVTSTTGFYAGEAVGIGDTPDSYVIDTIDSPTQLTLTANATATYAIGKQCVSIMSTFYFTGDGCSLSNLKIDGNSANWPVISTDCGAEYEIDFYNGNRFLVDRVEVTNSRHRPLRGRGEDMIVTNCYFHDMSKYGGVHIEGIAGAEFTNVLVKDSTFIMPSGIATTTPAFLASFGDYLRVVNCHIFGGMSLRVTDNSIVSGCTFTPNDSVVYTHLILYGCQNVNVLGNLITGIKLDLRDVTIGILYETKNIVVSGNSIANDGRILIAASIENINITSNSFVNIPTYNALEATGGTGTEIKNINISNNDFHTQSASGVVTVKLTYNNGVVFSGNTEYASSSNQFISCDSVIIKGNLVVDAVTHVFRIVTATTDVLIEGNIIVNGASRGISLETNATAPTTPVRIMNNNISAATPYYTAGAYTNVTYIGNANYIAPGEIRTASGTLTAGAVNTIGFAWHNPELQDIFIKKVVIEVVTASTAVTTTLQVGIADDAVGTNLGSEFFTALLMHTVAVDDSYLAGDTGAQTKWVVCQDSVSAIDGWVVGKILLDSAEGGTYNYYIEYAGRQ